MKYLSLIPVVMVLLTTIVLLSCKDQKTEPYIPPMYEWWTIPLTEQEKKRDNLYYTAVCYYTTLESGKQFSVYVTYQSTEYTDHTLNMFNNVTSPTNILSRDLLEYPKKGINVGDMIVTQSGKVYTIIKSKSITNEIILDSPFDPTDNATSFLCIRHGNRNKVTVDIKGD